MTMIIVQPSKLKEYFDLQQELSMQDQLTEFFKAPRLPGFHLCVVDQKGTKANYYVAFSIELPDSGKPFIIEVLLEDLSKISYKNFLLKVNAKTEEPWNNPNRLIALALHNQKNGIV